MIEFLCRGQVHDWWWIFLVVARFLVMRIVYPRYGKHTTTYVGPQQKSYIMIYLHILMLKFLKLYVDFTST